VGGVEGGWWGRRRKVGVWGVGGGGNVGGGEGGWGREMGGGGEERGGGGGVSGGKVLGGGWGVGEWCGRGTRTEFRVVGGAGIPMKGRVWIGEGVGVRVMWEGRGWSGDRGRRFGGRRRGGGEGGKWGVGGACGGRVMGRGE